jgi:hypothetical protein
MLAMFPAGSCVVAEINGQKELVFFDAKKAEEGFVLGGKQLALLNSPRRVTGR